MSKQENNPSRHGRPGAPHRGGRLVRAELKAYLDGELSGLRRWLVQWHLVGCAECREELTWLQRLGRNMQSLEEARPDPGLRSRIMASLPDTPPAPRTTQPAPLVRSSPLQRNGLRLALCGGLTVLALGAVFALSQRHTSARHTPAGASTLAAQTPAPTPPATSALPETPSLPTAPVQDPFALPEDPTSRQATEMSSRSMKIQEAQEARQQQQNWNRMLAATRISTGEGKAQPTETVCVVLAVSNISAASQRLQIWAKRMGGSALPAKNTGEVAVATGGEILFIRVPAEHGNAMLGTLKQIGSVALNAQPLRLQSGAENVLPAKLPVKKTAEEPAPPVQGAAPPESGLKSEANMKATLELRPAATPSHEASTRTGDLVTVTVMLESSNRPVK